MSDDDFLQCMEAWAAWSDATFGPPEERGPEGALAHLAKEIFEVLENPGDVMEYVDMLALVMDSARRAGFPARDVLREAWAKLEINRQRDVLREAWAMLEINRQRELGTPGPGGETEHIRDE